MANILIADADPGIRQVISDTLQDSGFQLLFAEDGIKATELFEKSPIHVVLADNDLPGKDAFQLLRDIKKIHPQTAVIVMTGMENEDSEELMDAGAFATISKPFNVQEIKRIIADALPNSLQSLAQMPAQTNKDKKIAAPLKAAIFIFLLLILSAIGVGIFHFTRIGPIRIYPVPYNHMSGIAFDGKNLWTADWFNQKFHQHNLDAILSLKQSFSKEDYVPVGISWDGKNFWSVSSWAKKVVRHGEQFGKFELEIDSPVKEPSALYCDGQFFWFCDSREGKIVKCSFEEKRMKVIESANSPGQKPAGIYKDKKFLWTSDSKSGLIYKHALEQNFKVLVVYALPDEIKNEKISCFTSDGVNFWIGSEASQKIYQIHPKHLKLVGKLD